MTDEPTAPDIDDAADTTEAAGAADTVDGAEEPVRRRGLAMTLIVVGTVVAFLAVFAIWVQRQALDTENWTKSSSELLDNPAIRGAVSAYLVDQLYANVNVQGELRNALPQQFKGLSGPAAGALRNVAGNVANQALERPRVQTLWEQANRALHQRLLQVIKGGNGAVSTSGGVVSIDLGALLSDVSSRTGVGGTPCGQAAAGRGEHRDPAVGPVEDRAEHRERHPAARDHPDGDRAAAVRASRSGSGAAGGARRCEPPGSGS